MTARDIISGIAMVLVVEGLVYALAPSLLERMLALMSALPENVIRRLGLATLATGVAILWIVHG
ncbi:DUF2065 domain-containing protein [Mesobacterium sp. TK19101]|uniref:DUF2065 domain-containing protein n=1 Tax=Mesobacterium hydrothermale TaxID=3111907 RepID=A0ABU6HIG1_9RHOB|nr:DUF2065 domain-containing protein [Mesobacterium sp. TK19101]MEC3862244.1 DUF2065 domain-containing protein [Mesobacterium sp. TK19101]